MQNTMQSLVLSADGKSAVVKDIPVPIPGPLEIQVRVRAVALNAVDALYTANPLGQPGRTIGSDFAGTVSMLGSAVTAIQINQRVAGFLQGACSVNERPGAFAEYLVVPADLVWLVPQEISLAQAATVSLCALTAAQALHLRLGLPSPFWSNDHALPTESNSNNAAPLNALIYSASTSVALYAAQLIHRSSQVSKRPVTIYGVASPAHHSQLRQSPYHYQEIVDYKDPEWPSKIMAYSGGKAIDIAFDCISEGPSVTRSSSTLTPESKIAVVRSREGGAWVYDQHLMPSEPLYGAVWAGLGEKVDYQGMTVPASLEARRFAVQFYEHLSKSPLLSNKVRIMPGGLGRIPIDGFALLGSGTMEDRAVNRNEEWMRPIRGEKLVYQINLKP